MSAEDCPEPEETQQVLDLAPERPRVEAVGVTVQPKQGTHRRPGRDSGYNEPSQEEVCVCVLHVSSWLILLVHLCYILWLI